MTVPDLGSILVSCLTPPFILIDLAILTIPPSLLWPVSLAVILAVSAGLISLIGVVGGS